jgi:hypothetical protein
MKLALGSIVALLLQINAASAYVTDGPCAKAAAKEARTYAAQSWNTTESKLKIDISRIMTSSNPAPIEIYGVGITSATGTPVLFDVALNNIGGKCTILEVRFAEFLE